MIFFPPGRPGETSKLRLTPVSLDSAPQAEGPPAAVAARAGLLSRQRWRFLPRNVAGQKRKLICLFIHPHNLPFYQVRLGERLFQTFSFFSLIKLAAIDFNNMNLKFFRLSL
ncbi:MAG: hypothetical protein K9K64_16710 [Desulfohalobiaceae bacterium]|nr:hypothetical protein [Desulfohalobiaceae bacterium]